MSDQIDNTQDAATEPNQESTPATEVATASDGMSDHADQSGPADSVSGAPAEDSGEPGTKKAEAANDEMWKKDLLEFHDRVNGVLAAKENLQLVAVDQKIHSAYSQSWKRQCNRYFQLSVALRRRLNNGKVGGKSVA